jgi:hypothetical protein
MLFVALHARSGLMHCSKMHLWAHHLKQNDYKFFHDESLTSPAVVRAMPPSVQRIRFCRWRHATGHRLTIKGDARA